MKWNMEALRVSCWMIFAENQISLLKSGGVKTAE
jgi:hypothetical protein